MIYVRLELWPKGDRARSRLLGEGTIENIGGTHEVGSYRCVLLKSREHSKRPGNPLRPTRATVWKYGHVEGFARRSRSLGPWDLLLRCLRSAIGSRNPGPEPEPGQLIAETCCPCCGAKLRVEHGDDPGEIGVIGEPAGVSR